MKHEMTPRDRFVLRFGVFGYGGGMVVIFTLLHLIRLHMRGLPFEGISIWLLVNAAIWLPVGYLFGTWMWKRITRRR